MQLHTVRQWQFFTRTEEKMDSYFWERSASLPRDLLRELSLSSLFEEAGGSGGGAGAGDLRQENEEIEGVPNFIL